MPTPAERLESVETKLDWLVQATKILLAEQAGVELEAEPDDEWAFLDEPADEEYIVPVHAPKAPKRKPCPHNQQTVVDGAVTCARCGTKLVQGGVVGDPNRNGNQALQAEWGANSMREASL